MMRRTYRATLLALIACLLTLCCCPCPAAMADDAAFRCTIDELIDGNSVPDGTLVTFYGEAIGEPLDAGNGYKWVNLEGSSQLLGVYMTDEQCDEIANWGDYGTAGTTVEVTGTFNLTCEEHRGDLDVHASQVEVTATGGETSRAVSPYKFYVGGALIAIGVALMLFYNHRRKIDL